jgi:AraC-like DNA-binding protein
MDIRIHIPVTSQLTAYVTGIWELKGGQNIKETILPQGVVEIIFNLGDPMYGVLPFQTESVCPPLSFLQGVHTKIVNVYYPGKQHLFGIRLQPALVKSLFGIFPNELKNTIIDLQLLKPSFSNLWHQLKDAASFEERVKLIEDNFPSLSEDSCIRTQKLCKMFLADGINEFNSIENLSQQVYYSKRHLNRKTQSIFGISAEELITYKKFLHAVKQLHQDELSLTSIAHGSGFFDQAHFCRTFKSYSGITAKQYRLNHSPLAFHLFDNVSNSSRESNMSL